MQAQPQQRPAERGGRHGRASAPAEQAPQQVTFGGRAPVAAQPRAAPGVHRRCPSTRCPAVACPSALLWSHSHFRREWVIFWHIWRRQHCCGTSCVRWLFACAGKRAAADSSAGKASAAAPAAVSKPRHARGTHLCSEHMSCRSACSLCGDAASAHALASNSLFIAIWAQGHAHKVCTHIVVSSLAVSVLLTELLH